MKDMSGRVPYGSSNPLTSQQRADAQVSNPATPITATAPLESTQPTENLRSSDPSNGGVVPVDGGKLGSGLKNWGGIGDVNLQISAAKADESNIFSKKYGLDTGGYSMDEAKNFNETMQDPNNSGIVYGKQVTKKNENYGDQSLQAKFLDAVNTIDLDKKTAGSGVGVNPNIGIDIDTIVQLTEELLKSSSTAKNDPNLGQAYNAYITALNEALKTGNPDAIRSAIEGPAGALKVALAPIVDKAMWKEWYDNNKVETQQYLGLKKISEGLKEYSKYYDASSDELKSAIAKYREQTGKYNVAYKEIIGPNAWQTKSQNAAGKLKSSPLYQNFIGVMEQVNPDLKGVFAKWKQDSVISDEEKDFLEKNLFGHESIKQMTDLRSRMIAEQGPGAAAYFKDYQEIIDLKKTLYATGIDDYLERATNIPANYDLKNLRFQVKTGY